MSIVIVTDKVTPQDLQLARQDYGDYVKIVADIASGTMAIGGQWHADAEKILLEQGSRQDNLWGGGVDLTTHTIETIALINLRPNQGNDSQDILDPQIRSQFMDVIKQKFNL